MYYIPYFFGALCCLSATAATVPAKYGTKGHGKYQQQHHSSNLEIAPLNRQLGPVKPHRPTDPYPGKGTQMYQESLKVFLHVTHS